MLSWSQRAQLLESFPIIGLILQHHSTSLQRTENSYKHVSAGDIILWFRWIIHCTVLLFWLNGFLTFILYLPNQCLMTYSIYAIHVEIWIKLIYVCRALSISVIEDILWRLVRLLICIEMKFTFKWTSNGWKVRIYSREHANNRLYQKAQSCSKSSKVAQNCEDEKNTTVFFFNILCMTLMKTMGDGKI